VAGTEGAVSDPCDRCESAIGEHAIGQYMICTACYSEAGRRGFSFGPISPAAEARGQKRLDEVRRAVLRLHLDRKPPTGVRGEGSPWRRWFEGDSYLGEAYADGRQAAKVGASSTNGGKLWP
jgi:hypothetical protein